MSSRFKGPRERAPIAPVHRGPQALPPGASAAAPYGGFGLHAPNAALLIDFDNVTMGIQKDMQGELRNLMSSDIIKGKVSVQRAYADWRRYPGYIVPLTEASIDLIFAPAYGSAKKNATDIRLAIDAMELVFTRPEIGTFILLSGDSDFSSLVIKLKEYGKYVIGVGIRESSSDLLVQNCDEYYSYNALAGLVRAGDEEIVRWDPWELVTEAVGRMTRNGDVMRADRLKQVMQDIDPGFDEKDLGMSKFSRFVHEAEKRRLLTLTRMENGQFEIGAVTTGAAPAPAPAVESRPAPRREQPRLEAGAEAVDEEETSEARDARVAREERSRGRRGRRGRGRDFERAPRPDETAAEPTGELETIAEPTRAVEAIVAPSAPAAAAVPAIGTSGERLTRNEAFDLVRRAVESLVTGDESIGSAQVRARAAELLGRDSESLGERMFERVLRDAHDADLIDLRRRGDAYELARAAQAESVADQLNRAAAAQASPADEKSSAAAAPRGMGPRSLPRGRTAGRGGPPPADLLSVGVVSFGSPAGANAAPAIVAAVAPAPALTPAPLALPPASASAAAEQPSVPLEDGGSATVAPESGEARPRSRGRRGGARKGAPAKVAAGPVAAAPVAAPPAPAPIAPPAPVAPPVAAKTASRGRRGGAKAAPPRAAAKQAPAPAPTPTRAAAKTPVAKVPAKSAAKTAKVATPAPAEPAARRARGGRAPRKTT